MIKKFFLPAVFLFGLLSCASSRAVIKSDYDFGAVRTVKVGRFSSESENPGSGSAVQSAFIRHLLSKGYAVKVDPESDSDVIIDGSVTVYVPDKKYLIRQPEQGGRHNKGSQTVIYTDDITEIGGSSMYDLGTAFGLRGTNRIMASNATVGIYAYMVDRASGEIVWTDTYTYEGLDLASALDGAVRFILRSLPRTKMETVK